ncbi:hypothetical protein QFI91_14065 [Raoultella sp. WB_B2P2-3]|jgi:hypothetical protein|uniref:Uncharacterized protein n=1 Tax=Raoultella scottii TaxID=3040937 RepID=A0ABU8ZA61_9ENTR|nr:MULTISPECIES: hypothetical protein [Enterobacteriaceae]
MMSKKRRIGRLIAAGKTPPARLTLQAEIEALKIPPRTRAEAKRQLAIKLRLLKSGALNEQSLRELEKRAAQDLSLANARRFEAGVVDAVTTEKISLAHKKWRGRTAD